MSIKFVTGEPALLADKTLFVADVHVGIEHEFRKSGLNMSSQTQALMNRIESLIEKTRARRLVLMGDIKHKVPGISWQETREVPVFLQSLSEKAEVRIIPGNHDGGIADFVPKGVKLYPTQGGLIGEVYASHGHAWPEPSFLQAKYFVMSHSHPQVEFRDRLGYSWRERVWIRASLDLKKMQEKYHTVKSLPELIVMPAFNPLSGGIPVNRKKKPGEKEKGHINPVLKSAKMKTAKIYMLDGTYLGEAGKL